MDLFSKPRVIEEVSDSSTFTISDKGNQHFTGNGDGGWWALDWHPVLLWSPSHGEGPRATVT